MALDFNLLNTNLPEQIAGSFTRGYEGAQDRANVLEQREQQKRTQMAQIIQNGARSIVASPGAYKSIFARVKKVAGVPLDDDERRYDEAFATGGEEGVKKLAMADADFDIETVLSLRDREAYEAYLRGQKPVAGTPTAQTQPAAAPTIATKPANSLLTDVFQTAQAQPLSPELSKYGPANPLLGDVLKTAQAQPSGASPRGYAPETGNAPALFTPAPTNALAPTTQSPVAQAPVNALAPASVDRRTAILNEIEQLSRFTDPRAAARVKALEKQLDQLKMIEVGGNMFDPVSRQFILGPAKSDILSPEAEAQKIRIAAAGRAPGTTVNISNEKKFGEAFAKNIADADVAKLTTAEGAPRMAQSANRILELANRSDVFTGPAANVKLNIARALNIVGANNQQLISNTEQLIAATGQSTLDAIKGAGLGAGQGFTDKDLKFLQGVAGGTIELTSTTLKELARLQHLTATKSAESWNKRVKQIPSSAIEGTGLSLEPITVPPLFKSVPTATTLTPQDRQALEWANSNPKDPRALQIKQRLGQ